MKNIIAICLTIIMVSSCEKDIKVNVPEQPKKLVIHGVTAMNNPFRVTIGKTAGILDLTTNDTYKVTDALVLLYENNVLKDTLVPNQNNSVYVVKRNTVVQAGKTYLLKAEAPGLTSAEAETVTPNTIAIQSITRRQNVRTDANGRQLDELKITFADDGTQTNNYIVKVRRPTYYNGTSVEYSGIYCMRSSDKDIERGNNVDPTDFESCIDQEFFMMDKNFNGRVKEILLFVDHEELRSFTHPVNNRTMRPLVELNSITPEHFKYRKSYDAYQDSEDNPFAEPVLVYTNVKNGYGVFTTYSIARDTIR